MNVLFVCTLNKARSRMAEAMHHRVPGIRARSAGVDPRAVRVLDVGDLAWADLVVVFESGHIRAIHGMFAGDLPRIVDAGVPDGRAFGDPGLARDLAEALEGIVMPAGRSR